jgi:hypothetical protein
MPPLQVNNRLLTVKAERVDHADVLVPELQASLRKAEEDLAEQLILRPPDLSRAFD